MEGMPNPRLHRFIIFITLCFTLSSCAVFYKEDGLKTMSPEQRRGELFYTQGTRKLMDKEYAEALSHLLEAAKLMPNDTRVHNNLGMAYFFRGRSDMAIEHLNRAVSLDSNNSDARINLGSVLQRNGQFSKALEQYEEVLSHLTYSHNYRTHFNMALIFEQQGQTRKALAHLEQSISENNEYCPALFKMGKIYYNNRRFEQANHYFQEASLGTCHENPAPMFFRGMATLRQQDPDAASKIFEDVIELYPGSEYANQARQQLREMRSHMMLTTRDRERRRSQSQRNSELSRQAERTLNPTPNPDVIDMRGSRGQQTRPLEFREYSSGQNSGSNSNSSVRTPSF